MKFLTIFLVMYVSPGCLSQCVNCASQPAYQSPCCVPTSNVQTIQSARAFTNGAQGSQVIMYYNGQRIVSGVQQQQQQQQGSNFNQANNYQNPGPIPAPGYQTGYDQNQNQVQNQTGYYPGNLNGGVIAGGTTAGSPVVGGIGQQVIQNGQTVNVGGNVGGQNINAGGVVGGSNQNQNQFQNQNQNVDPYQNQENINTGGNVGNQNQYQNQFPNQDQNMNSGYGENQNQGDFQSQDQNQGQYQNQNQDQNFNDGYTGQNQNENQNQFGNQNQNQYQDQNQNNYQEENQGSTLAPFAGEVGYQPFVPSGNTNYNNAEQGQFDQGQQQNQQSQSQQDQNNQQVIYPGASVTGGTISGSSYNSPNSGYVNSQAQPQTYPTQVVTGGPISNQNVQQQPDVNSQYQDQINYQNQQNMDQPGSYQGNQQSGIAGSSTTQQGQYFTTAPNNQFQQGQQEQQGQQGIINQQQNQQFTSSPGYQEGDLLTEGSGTEENEFLGGQQQFTSSTNDQSEYMNGQQGYTENTLTPPVQVDNTQFSPFPSSREQGFQSSSPTPFPVIYPAPEAGEPNQALSSPQTQPSQGTQPTPETPRFQSSTQLPYPNILPVSSAGGQETSKPFETTSTVSSYQDEYGPISSQFQNGPAFETTTLSSNFVPGPALVPGSQNQNNGNAHLESSTFMTPTQNNIGIMPIAGSSTSGPFFTGVQGQGSTNSYQSTTPITTTNFNNGQSSNGFQSTTGMPVTNDMNQSGFIASSTMDPNIPQAQYPSQQEVLAANGQQPGQSSTNGGSIVSTQAPQFPSQQELGATAQNIQPTPAPQFPAQQDLGARTTQNQNYNGQQGGTTQQTAGVTPQFPSQEELLQRDQQNSGATGQIINESGFTPQYGDMNTQYGHYASSTVKASSNPQFDQPTANQQQPQNTAGGNFNMLIVTLLLNVFWW